MNLSAKAKAEVENIAVWAGYKYGRRIPVVWQRFDTPLDECIARDAKRGLYQVGRAVIENTALYNDLIPWNEYRQLAIVDMDGTLTDCEWRREKFLGDVQATEADYLKPKPKQDWKGFLENCGLDMARLGVLLWVRELQKEYDIVIVSGRNERYFPQTDPWLARHGVHYKRVFLRKDSDHRPDFEVKNDILKHIPHQRIALAIDDRPSVVDRVWRANGIKVYPVGDYEHYW
jgi:hypothetical protein